MDRFRQEIVEALEAYVPITSEEIDQALEVPPDPKLGDYAFPCFPLAKALKKAPADIAKDIASRFTMPNVTAKAVGPYLNFFIEKKAIAESVIKEIQKQGETYGRQHNKSVVLVESPGPNTNKPLHLGHLRNILLGSTITNILRFYGNDVHIVNVVNDRGVHICKSMLAYQKFGNGLTPEKAKRKSDYFVGDFYVKYAQAEKDHPEYEQEIQQMLVKWEDGDPETIALWKKMNSWAVEGFKQTYKTLNFNIERDYYESDTYRHGKDIILDGLKKGIFQKDEEGAVIADLEKQGLGKKVLLRGNGTSVYITQDIYMAKKRQEDYKFNEMIYVVGNEQEFHFKVLFEVFRLLGWKFADSCYHFSYGMVELPEGKMKSREGNVVDIDELIEGVMEIAKAELKERYPELAKPELERRTKAIAMAAIRFFFLKFDPPKNFVYNPKESLSFEGETGPYVLYAYARICSIFSKLGEKPGQKDNAGHKGRQGLQKADISADLSHADLSLLTTEPDRKLVTTLSAFKDIAEEAAARRKPSLLAHYLFELATAFTEYYHLNPILKENPELRDARLALIDCVRTVLKTGLNLLDIEVLEEM